jgi:hypothetical protein
MTESTGSSDIREFLDSCRHTRRGEPNISLESANAISAGYFENLRTIPDASIRRIIEVMKHSIQGHRSGRNARDWEGCCIGVAQYLLSRRFDEPDRIAAAHSVVLLSLFCHTLIPGYQPYRPVACEISTMIWGRIIPNHSGMLVASAGRQVDSVPRRLGSGLMSFVLVWLLPAIIIIIIGSGIELMMMLRYGKSGWQAFLFAATGGLVIGFVRVAAWIYRDRRRFG